MKQSDLSYLTPRRFGSFNSIGFLTLYNKEVMRFIKVYLQTLIAPAITTLLFFSVFSIALGEDRSLASADIQYLEFIAPGLILMAMVQSAFANTSSSIMISKMSSSLPDILLPPLSAFEMVAAFSLAAVTRGLIVGAVCVSVFAVAIDIKFHSPFLILYYGIFASMMLSLLGLIGGLWADKFDHIAAVTNFFVTPLTFLSGTFYSISRLPEQIQAYAVFNPFFCMINGFRYGFLGHSDGHLLQGGILLFVLVIGLFAVALRMVHCGYKIQS